ncbi:hypothetical protein [Thermoplasma volcanium GSS1]|uniref:Transcription regulator PadR N-terminal domain-containing protein n=1 Tax=Thermoplasma volcanium (strain ATCC 51530 / DSM 4299 / JCM 9571 / NBRC 15438 / GSS1) TaxID=273116 RepID=Q977Z7_THEVO|nr:PadR family transcriptional regulator [Thermoplasma volcanium]BAB60662.1 hypothetical protein [Thermoplasma volcanium GSS1]
MFGGMRGPCGHHVDRSRGFVGIRYWILRILADGEKTGADIMTTIENLTMGRWRPSPGAVYPILRALEEEGYIKGTERDNKKYYSLLEKGKEMIDMLGFGKFYGRDVETTNLYDAVERIGDYVNYLKDNSSKLKDDKDAIEKLRKIRDDIEGLIVQ